MAAVALTQTRAKILPPSKPTFTLRDLKEAIPPHCFNRSILKSLSYVIYDLAIISFFYHVASNYFHLLPHPLSYVVWPVYWFCQSVMLVTMWILGHECCHNGFSDYLWLNNTVGMILHTCISIPYFSWRITHLKTHTDTGEHDEIDVPKRKAQTPWIVHTISKCLFENPIVHTIKIVIRFTFGGVFYNFLGGYFDAFTSQYNPYSPIFSEKERPFVWISNAAILAFAYVLYSLAMVKGFPWLFLHYLVPHMGMIICVVLGNFLSYTDNPALPDYASSEWDWLRQALVSLDRDYGFMDRIWHNNHSTHVVHNFCSTIPHYHATEATNAIKPILGEFYNFDGTSILKAIWQETTK